MRRMLLAWMLLCVSPHAVLASDSESLLGAWRLDDGRVLTMAPSADGTWRYRHMQDGRSGGSIAMRTGGRPVPDFRTGRL